WGGIPRQLLEIVHRNHTLCFSLSMLAELDRVLRYPKFAKRITTLSLSSEELLERLTEHALVIKDPVELNVIVEDPADNKFLACAVTCGARLIISGDDHLLKLKAYKHIAIVEPKEALNRLKVTSK
ncbi:MAG: putative toxin-antitoxin system toxin component, PIN family, partial [Candidatus Andersenbacteria bacterium]|nr:putative toxin-antitoxin system toxin component, PIN family [Candidatus Andersenbacteria bacterium]